MAHHKFTNDPENDPELAIDSKASHIWQLSGLPFWAAMIRELFSNAITLDQSRYIPAQFRRRIRCEAQLVLGIYGLALMSLSLNPVLFWIWFLPLLLGQPFLRLYLMAEHAMCDFSPNMFANTRTILTNPVVRFIAWNMPYHAEHHTMPQVPYYRLAALHGEIRDHVKHTSDGYLRFSRALLTRDS